MPDAARKLDDLFAAHSRRVLAYAMRRTPVLADAEDAAAETFAIAWRKVDQAPDEALGWLLAITRRVIANQRRGQRRRSWLFLKLQRSAAADAAVPAAADTGDGPVLAALARLRPDDQELLRLVAWDELDHSAIAGVMGITANAVAVRLHRARARLRDELLKESGPIRTSNEQKGAINGAVQEHVE